MPNSILVGHMEPPKLAKAFSQHAQRATPTSFDLAMYITNPQAQMKLSNRRLICNYIGPAPDSKVIHIKLQIHLTCTPAANLDIKDTGYLLQISLA